MHKKMADFAHTGNPKAEIKVVGVGGGGGNAVTHMYKQGIRDVDFVICNTDAQAMNSSPVPTRVQLGASLTEGRGAGNKPEVGKQAATENIEDVMKVLAQNTKMVFITAGMGGGTGTGGAPVIARACREMGFLTVGIVTIPFKNEGRRRIRQAVDGISELEDFVDSLLVVNNERIREMYGDFGISEAFAKADNILATAAKGIAEIITVPGYINVDFADVETVLRNSGLAIMGTGIAGGENRSEEAVEIALTSPLLNNNDIRGAKNILLNINSGNHEVTMDEVGRITDYVQNKAGFDADIIWGNGKDETLEDNLSVTVIAAGFGAGNFSRITGDRNSGKESAQSEVKTNNLADNNDEPRFKRRESKAADQKIIEFDIAGEKDDEDFEALYPNTLKERGKVKQSNMPSDFSSISDEDVDELENIPAYKRRQIRINDPKYKNKYSNYSVTSENKISDRNSYLHDKVD